MKRQNVRLDAAWLSRPEPAAHLMAALRREFHIPIVFDTVDLHYRRLEREASVRGRDTKWRTMQRREIALAREADVTVTGGDSERALLRAEGIARAFELPVIEPLPPAPVAGWDARSGIVFFGNYAHAPNVDAARWLCEAIVPLVRQRLPDVDFTLAARTRRGPCVRSRRRRRVAGFVPDAAALLARARVFAVPLRFGAGTKGKTVYALAARHSGRIHHGRSGRRVHRRRVRRHAGRARRFAARIVELYEDRARWERLSAAGRAIAARFTPAAAGRKLDAMLAALGFER